MPTDTNVHKKNKKKNFVVLAIIIFFIALIWAMTMVRTANAETMDERSTGALSLFSKDKTEPKHPFGSSPTVFAPKVVSQPTAEITSELTAQGEEAVKSVAPQEKTISMDDFRDRVRNKETSAPVPMAPVSMAVVTNTAPSTNLPPLGSIPHMPAMPAAPVAPVTAQVPRMAPNTAPKMAYGAKPGKAPRASTMAAPNFASSNDPYLPEGQYPSFIVDARSMEAATQRPQRIATSIESTTQYQRPVPMPLAVPVQSETITTTTTKVTTFGDDVMNTRKDYGTRRNAPARYAGTEIMTEEATDIFAAPKAPVVNTRQPAAFSRRGQSAVISKQ